ncbi:hypothetical protein AB205_0039000 [Aquarana catesbeiana]|uniref:Uncharacterized protein n=1 Tax=Aquarana catesbeiana TaxID=8400 RepID=A0A2G9QKQ5_AQUCT|nr:hypothetical protein AB205_0039000 [Aquarana catesbeiana]
MQRRWWTGLLNPSHPPHPLSHKQRQVCSPLQLPEWINLPPCPHLFLP